MAYTRITWERLRALLKAKWEGQPFWSDLDARDAVNEALQVWNLLTGTWKTRVPITTAPGLFAYSLPNPLVFGTRVEFNGRPLSKSGREDLNLGRYTWRAETTASGGDVPRQPKLWAPYGLLAITIWPADAVGWNSLVVDGVAATPVLTEDDSYVDLGEETLQRLLGYALHAAAFKKGGSFFQATQAGYKAFLAAAAEVNDQIKTSQVYRRALGIEQQLRYRGTATALDGLTGRASNG